MFDISAGRDRRFDGYGPSAFPNPLDDEISLFVSSLRAGGIQAVSEAISASTEHGRRHLQAYAERMAILAVRTNSRDVLRDAVIANVVGGLSTNERESLMVMAPIDDAAKRIGIDLADLFEEVSKIVGHPGTVSLVSWLSRTPENRSLEAMRFVAQECADGFRYVLSW